MNMREVAQKLNIPYTTYVNYEKGMREPSSEMLITMANFYGVTLDHLIGRDNSIKEFPSPNVTEEYTSFPVIGNIAAGYEHIANESWDGDFVDIPNSYLKGRSAKDFFVLRVSGDSMYPLYIDGDRVLILKQSTLNRSGDIGAIIYNGDNATLKKVEYVMGEDWMRLIPINPQYQPQIIEGVDLESCKVLGIPKLVIREV